LCVFVRIFFFFFFFLSGLGNMDGDKITPRPRFGTADRLIVARHSLIDLTLSSSSSSSRALLSHSGESEAGDTNSRESHVWTWGSGKYGRLGVASTTDASIPTSVAALVGRALRQVAAGSFVTAFLVDNGQLYMCGKDINGLFAGTVHPKEKVNEDYLTPVPISWFSNISLAHVAVGETMCCAIDEAGLLYWWGAGHTSSVVPFKSSVKFRTVACGGSHALAISADGACYAWGANEARQLSLAVPGEFCSLPTVVKLPPEVSSFAARVEHIACGFSSSALLLSDGSVFAAGTIVGQAPFKLVNFNLKGESIRKVYCTDLYTCVTTLLGEAFLLHSVPLPFSSETDRVARVFGDLSVRELVCGADFISCLTDSGSLHAWGRCGLQLGLGEVRAKKHIVGPKLVGSFAARFVRSVSCGTAHMTACLSPGAGGAREAVGWELLETERIYYRSLVIISEVFKPMAKPRSQLGKM
jgi:alpha-tubulin suppressor-like RCC1 family protein